MKAAFYTLGCKVNQNETAALQQLFTSAGYEVVPPEAPADVFVVNSCTVTAAGDAKSRRALRRARQLNPAVVTVLTGCLPQAFPEKMEEKLADVVTGTARRARVVDDVARFLATGTAVKDIAAFEKGAGFEELPAARQAGRTRAFIKIQDGCNRRCAYCIIPTARGPARSRGEAQILAEMAGHAGKGYAEVVFTGINLSSYGRDTGTSLAALAEETAKIEEIRRIRLSSLEPDLLDDEQIARFAACERLCGHFHLSLQSGSDTVLRRMRRPYTTAQYADTAHKLLRAMPGASLTTDIIVGFPGESEAEFDESLAFVKEMGFLKVHVFPFSARAGTPAAGFEGQLPKKEKAARATALQQAADRARAAFISAQQGTRHEVLLETPLPGGLFSGYTENYIPVAVPATTAAQGDILPVTLGAFDGVRCGAIPVAAGPAAATTT